MTTESNEKYGFEMSKLEVGDILLSYGNDKIAKTIAACTFGEFSHAMLYVGHSLIHATPKGVYSFNPQRLIFSGANHLTALRLQRPLTEVEVNDLITYARTWVGALYSIPQAMVAPVLSKRRVKDWSPEKQFCSRLVAQAYTSAGINLVKNPDYCAPNDFLRVRELTRVDGVVKILSPGEIDFANTHNYLEDIQEATFTFLKKVRELAQRRNLGTIAHHQDVAGMLMRHPCYDKVVSGYVKKSGYADYVRVDREANPFRYNPELLLATCKSKNIPVMEIVAAEQASIDRDWTFRERNHLAAFQNYHATPLEYFKIELNVAQAMMEELTYRKMVLDAVRDNVTN